MVPVGTSTNHRQSLRQSRSVVDVDAAHHPPAPDGRDLGEQRDPFIMTFPVHPLPAMQGPFEESMLDATGQTGHVPFEDPKKSVKSRQQQLCREAHNGELQWNFTYNAHWRHHPKGSYHPLRKTMAQIVFGVHLLHQHLEKSVADVADILLKHVNELDGFLQRANEDIEESLKDMLFRRKCLRVPMEHVSEFDRLLDDNNYRAQLLDGNIVIERTIGRMSQMLNDYLVDMDTFRSANNELDAYLAGIGEEWAAMNDDVGRIYSAMCGNTGGWAQFLQSLATKTERLGVVLVQVSSYCNEIEKRCGAASRRSLVASRSSSRNSSNSREAARSFRSLASNKPLPTVPNDKSQLKNPPRAKGNRSPDPSSRQKLAGDHLLLPSAADTREASDPISDNDRRRRESPEPAASRNHGSDVSVSPAREGEPERDRQESVPGHDRLPEAVSDDSNVTLRQDVYRPEPTVRYDDEKEVLVAERVEIRKPELSPPLYTGKDSAYSSISGGSYAIPAVTARSGSSQSSHARTQFGLFPSSAPATPGPGRLGAVTPESPSTLSPDDPLYVPPRPPALLEDRIEPPRRFTKKSSLSSLKKLFTKRKYEPVETIAE